MWAVLSGGPSVQALKKTGSKGEKVRRKKGKEEKNPYMFCVGHSNSIFYYLFSSFNVLNDSN